MADQVYVTHCLQNDSIKNQAGFGVRATSTDDPELLKFAAEYPAYELPLDMWGADPTPAQAPRRLAMAPVPGRDVVALIHSAYVSEDTMGRRGNYFTHILFYPSLSAAQALESWGAADWRTSYPTGETSKLRKASDQPHKGTVLTPDILTRFLSGKGLEPDGDLATLVCPARLQKDPERCKDLLSKTIEACLLAWHEGTATRHGLYLAAEPGLIALLLYGVVRLLPPTDASTNLTFSTFENAHRTLRHFRLVKACGTYLSDPNKGLDTDYFKTQGFGLDALAPDRCSPELAGETPTIVKTLVRQAAKNEWGWIREVQECHFSGKVSADSLVAAVKMRSFLVSARDGNLTDKELLECRRMPGGEALLQKNDDVFWPLIVKRSIENETVRTELAEPIRKRAPDLVAEAGRLLACSNSKTGDTLWTRSWHLLKAVEPSKEKLAVSWLSLLKTAASGAPKKPFLAAQRMALLKEWQHVYPAPATAHESIQELLDLSSAQEFEQLQKAAVPAEWLAMAIEGKLTGDQPAAWAIEAVHPAADKDLLKAVAVRLMGRAPDELMKKLRLLVPDYKSYAIFSSLLKSGFFADPKFVGAFLDGLSDNPKKLSAVWLQSDHLEILLRAMSRFKNDAEPIWHRFGKLLSKRLLLGDASQQALFEKLLAARDKCKTHTPAASAQLLDDWALLRELFHDPQASQADQEAVEAACERRALPGAGLLKEYYATIGPEALALVGTFDKFFPPGDTAPQHLARFDEWLKIVDDVQDGEKKEDLQLFFLEGHIPRDFRTEIAKKRLPGPLYAAVAKKVEQQKAKSVPVAKHADSSQGDDAAEPAGANYLHLGLATFVGFALGILVLLVGVAMEVLPRNDLEGKIKEQTDAAAASKKDVSQEILKLKKEIDGLNHGHSELIKQVEAKGKAYDDKVVELGKFRQASFDRDRELRDELNGKDERIADLEKRQFVALSVHLPFKKPDGKFHEIGSFSNTSLSRMSLTQSGAALDSDEKKGELTISLKAGKGKKLLTIKLKTEEKDTKLVMRAEKLDAEEFDKAMKHLEQNVVLVLADKDDRERRYCWFTRKESKP